ncbi:hypothetical protein C8J56DRAFT_907766 [Mycena floridula]|nr:hypothetical protein C8J56DRAFT_907766 [Mycena floridula]
MTARTSPTLRYGLVAGSSTRIGDLEVPKPVTDPDSKSTTIVRGLGSALTELSSRESTPSWPFVEEVFAESNVLGRPSFLTIKLRTQFAIFRGEVSSTHRAIIVVKGTGFSLATSTGTGSLLCWFLLKRATQGESGEETVRASERRAQKRMQRHERREEENEPGIRTSSELVHRTLSVIFGCHAQSMSRGFKQDLIIIRSEDCVLNTAMSKHSLGFDPDVSPVQPLGIEGVGKDVQLTSISYCQVFCLPKTTETASTREEPKERWD